MAKQLRFKATHEQTDVILALAYWLADNAWQNERLDKDDPEKTVTRETLDNLFDDCDKLGIPFWVQNAVIGYADDWRLYKKTYTRTELAKSGIEI